MNADLQKRLVAIEKLQRNYPANVVTLCAMHIPWAVETIRQMAAAQELDYDPHEFVAYDFPELGCMESRYIQETEETA